MRLNAIEMQGFKSFPEKTRITFDSGVTAIIGPNGSGKSNISDAIRWVLGEMSVKSLRGSRMEDVIFNGAVNKPAANCASVTLCIDTQEEYNLANHQRIEAEPEEPAAEEEAGGVKARPAYSLSDGPEVTVTRKYYRSGESEYYINKKQVRLKDIYELFYDTSIRPSKPPRRAKTRSREGISRSTISPRSRSAANITAAVKANIT